MILIALGSNLPFHNCGPAETLRNALDALQADGDIRVAAVSSFWRSQAWPDPSAPAYVNAAARLTSDLGPEALLARMQAVEKRFGRVRDAANQWASRTLDLDLIAHDDMAMDRPDLILPHPRAHARAFVLAPLAEIAAGWRGLGGMTPAELLALLPAGDIAATERLEEHTTP